MRERLTLRGGRRPFLLLCGLLLLVLSGCALPATPPTAPFRTLAAPTTSTVAAAATAPAEPTVTRTPKPTRTPRLTATAAVTATRTPKPTRTPRATITVAPARKATATPRDGLATIREEDLPREAHTTLRLIRAGGPFPYRQDGSTFQNREGLLPRRPSGYYREYTVRTPGEDDRGARRIVTGENGELYYTDDHYSSFKRVTP